MMPLKIIILLSLFCIKSFAQEDHLSGFIYNNDTGKGVYGAHVYWECSPTQGTISNEDGKFIISRLEDCYRLIISHIGYETAKHNVNGQDGISVGLTVSPYELSEVTISALDVSLIINRVIGSLKENHPSHPVYYYFFHREVYYSEDSTIHLLEEHTGMVEHKVASFIRRFENDAVLFKSRIGYFSSKGEEMFKDHRFISFSQIIWDNPVYDRRSHLHKRRSRDFDYRLAGKERVSGRTCYVVEFKANSSTSYPRGKLYIDTVSYAIVKEVLLTSGISKIKETSFVESNGKWYLNNVVEYISNQRGLSYRITLYNASFDNEPEHSFTSIGRLLPNFVKKKATSFDDNYWEEYNSVPLPNWIRTRIIKKSR